MQNTLKICILIIHDNCQHSQEVTFSPFFDNMLKMHAKCLLLHSYTRIHDNIHDNTR